MRLYFQLSFENFNCRAVLHSEEKQREKRREVRIETLKVKSNFTMKMLGSWTRAR